MAIRANQCLQHRNTTGNFRWEEFQQLAAKFNSALDIARRADARSKRKSFRLSGFHNRRIAAGCHSEANACFFRTLHLVNCQNRSCSKNHFRKTDASFANDIGRG